MRLFSWILVPFKNALGEAKCSSNFYLSSEKDWHFSKIIFEVHNACVPRIIYDHAFIIMDFSTIQKRTWRSEVLFKFLIIARKRWTFFWNDFWERMMHACWRQFLSCERDYFSWSIFGISERNRDLKSMTDIRNKGYRISGGCGTIMTMGLRCDSFRSTVLEYVLPAFQSYTMTKNPRWCLLRTLKVVILLLSQLI